MKKILFIAVIILLYNLSFPQKVDIKNFLIVAKDGTGDFVTIQEALNSIPQRSQKLFYCID